MIKASELRIGNWIMTKGIPYKATAQTILALEAIPSSSPNAILLNSEILEKCGFENSTFFEGVPTGVYRKNGLKVGLHGDDFIKAQYTAIFADDICVKVVYLHQLQNLYFVLTNEELIVNL